MDILTQQEIEKLLKESENNKNKNIQFSDIPSNKVIENNIKLLDIKQLRNLTGLSQQKFADKYYINIYTLRRWEQHVSEPPLCYLYSLNELFKYQGYFYDMN